MQRSLHRSAFTLVELSIVLVILGLLVGGVLAGQSLIRSAELRSITTEKTSYEVALNAFREKYFARPGDMTNAYQFWTTNCGADTTAPNTGCNGDGDGYIELNTMGELTKAWQHLALAGLVEGNYDGTAVDDGGGNFAATPTSVPKSKFPTAWWNFNSGGDDAAGSPAFPNIQLNLVEVDATNGSSMPLPSLTNGEAWTIDTKIDDGRANSGMLRGDGGNGCDDVGTDYYSLASTGADTVDRCILHFILR